MRQLQSTLDRIPAHRRGTVVAIATLLALAAPRATAAQSRESIADVSLEDLLNVEVTSVAKREQPLHQTASAVYVLTRDDIRRMGAATLAELMRGVPGLNVSRAGANRWAVSARGFNAQFANKMQVLLDGRSVYTPLFSGVYWDTLGLLPDDIERIEIIRGPGAAVWGANAVNGVINIITRSAADTQGQLLTSSFGGDDRWTFGGRTGGALGSRGYYRVYGRQAERAAILDASGADAHDGWSVSRGGGRVDVALDANTQVMLQGDVHVANVADRRTVPLPTPPYSMPLLLQAEASGGHLLGRWTRASSPDSSATVIAYFDRTRRPNPFLKEHRDNFGLEVQENVRTARRHLWTLGADYRMSRDDTSGGYILVADPSRTDHYVAAFAQDEIALGGGQWHATFGSKFEHNPYTGFEVQPSARVSWVPRPHSGLWAAISRSVRRPSRAEDGIAFNLGYIATSPLPTLLDVRGSDAVDVEVLIAYEGGARWHPTPWFSIDVSVFTNRYSDLLGAVPGEPSLVGEPQPHITLPLITANAFGARSHGLEVLSRWRARRLRVTASYSLLSLRSTGDTGGPIVTINDFRTNPTHQGTVRSAIDLPGRLESDTLVQVVSAIDGGAVPRHVRLDTRLGWRARADVDVGVGVRNALDPHYGEAIESLGFPTGRVPRRAFAELRFWF